MRLFLRPDRPRELLALVAVIAGAIALAAGVLLHFVRPAPPGKIVIATGGRDGGYYAFAQAYRQVLARSHVALEVRATAGSLENLALLRDDGSGVDLALLQGGVASGDDASGLVSLGRLFYEPLWIFARRGEGVNRLAQLAGKRIALGPEESGTYGLAKDVLRASGVTPDRAIFSALSGEPAVRALANGEVDVLIVVMAAEAPFLQSLLRNPEAELVRLERVEAYTRLLPFLTRLTLPAGVVSLVDNIPPADVDLLATSAVLVARSELHPELMSLLAQACSEVHRGPGLLHRAGDFPKPTDPEFAVSENALRYYRSGPPFMQRYVPFWIAILIERLLLLALPVLTVAIPLLKFVPALYKWHARERLLHWYGQLKDIESKLEREPRAAQLEVLLARIDQIDREVRRGSIPFGFSDQFYVLRGHIDFVRARVGSLASQTSAPEGSELERGGALRDGPRSPTILAQSR
jgi:TRAP transporter TAXI family solute receptor